MLGYLDLNENNFENAHKYFDKSLEICNKYENFIQRGLGNLAKAEVYIALTQFNMAKKFLDYSFKEFKEIGNDFQLKKVKLVLQKFT